MKALVVLGSGGHAKVVVEAARASGRFRVVGALDDRAERWGHRVLGVPVLGAITPEMLDRCGANRAILAIGANRARAEVAGRLGGRVAWATVIHPGAVVSPDTVLEEGVHIGAGAVVQPGTRIGRHAILNTSCSVDHDCQIGPFSHIAPGARLAGGVRVGEGALLGIGCCVIPSCTIGDWATVGAGGAVTRDIPPHCTAVGVPARVLRGPG